MVQLDRTKSTVKAMMKKIVPQKRDSDWPFLKDKLDMGFELRRPFENRWLISLSFLAGRQYAFYNQSAQMLQYLVQRKGRIRVVDNKILPRYRKQISRLIRTNPRMSVVPGSIDTADLKAAKIGDKVLKWYWRQHQMRKKIRTLGGWIYGCGNGFLGDRWDPKGGPIIAVENGQLRYAGDAEVDVWSPFEIGVPAAGLGDWEIDELPWLIKMKFRPLDWFVANYGDLGKQVPAETRPSPYVDTNVLFGMPDSTMTHKEDGAIWCELRIKPNAEFPNGLFLQGANGVILQKDTYPFISYHLEHFKDNEIPGVFWGMATTEAAVQLQKLWNRTVSDIAEFNRTMARGKWLVPRNSKMEAMPDDSHGQKLLYSPVMGHKPEMMDIKGLPATYQQMLEIIMMELMELYHQHEVTQGTNKSDIRSGDMVALLLEQDDFGNIPTHAIFEESLERVMSRVLQRIQKGYADDRVLTITGNSGEHEVFKFKGANLRDNTDVHVVRDSTLPESKLARQARIKDNYSQGLYGNPQDEGTRERVLRMLDEVPDDYQDIFKESHLDRQNAKVENYAMLKQPGVVYIVNPYDNHIVHMEEHRMFRKEPEYQKLKISNPPMFSQLEVTFFQHDQMHQKFAAQQRRAQLAELARLQKGGK